MFKFIYFISSFISFIIAFLIYPCATFSCIHDQIRVVQRENLFMTRSIKYKDIIDERQKSSDLFEPLQVYFYKDHFDQSISSNVIYNIDRALEKIRSFISTTFQVRKRNRPFLLQRESCTQRWHAGENRGKCSQKSNDEETCTTSDVSYTIPSRFLNKLEIYEYSSSRPNNVIDSGPGLLNSNFIAFLISQTSSYCEGTDVTAYGTYCRLNQETNEPLAGILNFCPTYFSKKIYSSQHYYDVILHEMFHILGFSYSLFEKFLPCRKGIFCDIPKTVVQPDDYDIPRMVYPLVIKNMQNHFSCNQSNFGGPMEVDNSTDIGYSSHWDPVLMYSSIMMPKFSEYDHIFVDNITLSLFGSTGWYRVNFSSADDFRFGKGEGCNFGSSCDGIYLCDLNKNITGCDLEHKTTSHCTSLSPNHPCGVFKPHSREDCESTLEKQYGLDFYSLGYQHKCFMVYKTDTDLVPYCLPVKCKSESAYDIFINMTWYRCESEKQVIGNVTVLCPNSVMFCSGARKQEEMNFCPKEESFFIAVRIYFRQPTLGELSKQKSFKNFKVTALRGIAENIEIPVNYIVNSSLSAFKQNYLDFSICPPSSVNSYELSNIVKRVQKFLDGGAFLHTLKSSENAIIASESLQIDPAEVIAFSDHEGFRSLLVFPVLCAIFLVTTFVASVVRHFLISRHKTERALENPDESNTVV